MTQTVGNTPWGPAPGGGMISVPTMKTSLKLSRILSLTALVGILSTGFLAGGCASDSTHASTGEYVDDTVITTKVKAALLGDSAVKSFSISVETVNDVVTLNGLVDTEAQRQAAARDAADVAGVRSVRNQLIVK